MAAPIFPNTKELTELLLAELPAGVYPEDLADAVDPERRSISSSEIRAHALMVATIYSNLWRINADKFLGTITEESITEWERQFFGVGQDSSQGLEARRAAVIAKLRSNSGISYESLRNVVDSVLTPQGIDFELSAWSGMGNGAWVLDDSELEMGSYLTAIDPLLGARADVVALDCNLDFASAGLTSEELNDIQNASYRFELRIFGDATHSTISLLDNLLKRYEPARSDHLILNNHAGNIIVPNPLSSIEWRFEDSELGEDTYLVSNAYSSED